MISRLLFCFIFVFPSMTVLGNEEITQIAKLANKNNTLIESHLDFITFIATAVIFVSGFAGFVTFLNSRDLAKRSNDEIESIKKKREYFESELTSLIEKGSSELVSTKDNLMRQFENQLSFDQAKYSLKISLESVGDEISEDVIDYMYSKLTSMRSHNCLSKGSILEKLIERNIDEQLTLEAQKQLSNLK